MHTSHATVSKSSPGSVIDVDASEPASVEPRGRIELTEPVAPLAEEGGYGIRMAICRAKERSKSQGHSSTADDTLTFEST